MLQKLQNRSRARLTGNRKCTAGVALCLITALSALLLSACAPGGTRGTALINEVVSSNSHSLVDKVLGSPDWIELYNPTQNGINLSGYRLTDKLDSKRGVFSSGTIPAGGYLVVYAEKSTPPAGSTACFIDYSLPKSGESLYLVNPSNVVVCQIAVPALLTDEAYARRANGTYGFCTAPTPGEKNDSGAILDASAMQDALKAEQLTLNEVLPKSASGASWVELYNPGKTEVNLSDYCLTDSKEESTKWHLPEQTLAAGQYAVVTLVGKAGNTGKAGSTDEMVASFNLGKNDTAVYLYDIAGTLDGSLTWQTGIPDDVSVVVGNKYTAFPTKGKVNSTQTFPTATPANMDSSDPVRISEVLPKNKYGITDSNKNHYDWVEVVNSGAQDVSLKGYYLSDNKNKLLKWAFPDTQLKAGSYLIVFLSGAVSKPEELHASFRLGQGETGVYLTNMNSYRVDSLALPAAIQEDVSVGRDASGKPLYYREPTPGAANAIGVADLSKIGYFDKSGVFISEVCAANKARSGLEDWVELHNGGSAAVNLAGYYLSDDASTPEKWKITALTIAPGGYGVIKATSNTSKQNANTADFGISPSGETLMLSNAEGILIDVFETGELTVGTTSGRVEGNNTINRVYFTTPTPGQPNAKQYSTGLAAMPAFSQTGLYQTTDFKLSITCATPNAKIYFTTDGSVPTKSSKAYTGPISISKNTPVRAVAYAGGLLPSQTATETYLFDAPHTVPVFCINGQPSQMNIVIRSNKMGYKPEYPCTAEYYTTDGTLATSFPTGLRPKGNLSLTYPQNSMTMMLRSAYGAKSVTYPFFSDSKTQTYEALTLRDSGEDYNTARMRDSLFQQIDAGMDIDTIDTKIVVVYINGAYQGVYDLVEEQNNGYLASHYGLADNNIDRIIHNDVAQSGNNKEFLRVSALAKSLNMADDKQFAELAKYVDIDACTDWLIAKTYFADGDIVNQRFWRARDYSVKWRPFQFDLDFTMRFNNLNRNMFSTYFNPVPPTPTPAFPGQVVFANPVVDNRIFVSLRKNNAWCDKFVQRYIQLAYTQYSPERILPIFDALKKTMEPEMAEHIAKWHTPSSMSSWESNTAILRNILVNRRPVALKQMQQFFHVSDATMQQYIAKYSSNS